MKKLLLTDVRQPKNVNDKPHYDVLKAFNNGLAEITTVSMSVTMKNNLTFTSKLQKAQEELMFDTYIGSFADGTFFRLVKPKGFAQEMRVLKGKGESISVGSMASDGYAVYFDLVDSNAPDCKDL